MAKHRDGNRRKGDPFNGTETNTGFSVLPMLAGSLVLIVVGTVIVTTLG